MRTLSEIATDILSDVTLKGSARIRAKPYLEALQELETVADMYFADRGDVCTLYAVSNLAQWRGESAKRLKAELRAHLPRKYLGR